MRLLVAEARQRRVDRDERIRCLAQRELRMRQPVRGKRSRRGDAEQDDFRVGGAAQLKPQLHVLLEAEVRRRFDRLVVEQRLLLERLAVLGLPDLGKDLSARGAGQLIHRSSGPR